MNINIINTCLPARSATPQNEMVSVVVQVASTMTVKQSLNYMMGHVVCKYDAHVFFCLLLNE